MIVVTGATGQLGALLIKALLERVEAAQIAAAVRNTEKASALTAKGVQVRQADYDKPEGWEAALSGADTLILISSSEVGKRAAQHQTVIDAAAKAGVKRIIYTSLLNADVSPLGLAHEHRLTEAALRDSGILHVVLRNGWYTENYTGALPAALPHGVLYGAAADGRIASASRADYAQAAAVVATTPGHEGKVYELAGDEAYTLAGLAAEAASQSGKPLEYRNLSQSDYRALLVQAGLPEGLADMLADSDAGASKGALYDGSGTLSRLIGRPTTTLAEAVRQALSAA